jgi:hypothetical protein
MEQESSLNVVGKITEEKIRYGDKCKSEFTGKLSGFSRLGWNDGKTATWAFEK